MMDLEHNDIYDGIPEAVLDEDFVDDHEQESLSAQELEDLGDAVEEVDAAEEGEHAGPQAALDALLEATETPGEEEGTSE